MDFALRDSLATEFAEVLRMIRDERWAAFSEAARQDDMEPYVALGRVLVRLTEKVLVEAEGGA